MRAGNITVFTALLLSLVSCNSKPTTRNRARYGQNNYSQQHVNPEQAWANYQPPPPRLPPGAQKLGGVRYSFLSPGMCLPGFAKGQHGQCVLGGTLLPNITQAVFPWLHRGANAPTSNHPQVTHATVMVESLLINATKKDGRCWDVGCDKATSRTVAQQAARVAATAIGASVNPYVTAFAVLAPIAASSMTHPDAAGQAYVVQNGKFSAPATLKVRRDTITPQWGLRFEHVPITPGTRLRLELVDADPDIPFTNGDDDMGIISINSDHLVSAIKARETHQVYVGKQTSDQVLFVGISVMPEASQY